MGYSLYVCQDLNELNMKMLFTMYHVMNRGRERHTIFHGDEYYLCFLETLAQAQLRFKSRVKLLD
jgi:hypothetical protein